MNQLHAIVYVSSAVRLLGPEDIERLLVRARRRNATEGITGLLLYADGAFMQYIEGPRARLMKVYDIITADALHTGLTLLMDEDTGAREFADWAMGYDTATTPEFLQLRQARWKRSPATSESLTPGKALLHKVWSEAIR
ncbi:hypothetical protein BH11PSE8_BH11PSE8_11730 [soil metagenome]